MEVKRLQFETQIGGYTRINPEFAKVKIHVMYEGMNRNHSIFSRETIEKMLPTLKNCPVVGEYIDENKNFGGHGGKIEISDEGIEFIDTTRPYGVVPSDTEITWERIREKNGMTEHDYLTCTAYLWVGRYPEAEKVINDGANQSMEIYPTKYEYDDDGNLVVLDGYFSALCILGKDSDPNKNYEPCFESADITRYSLDKEQFKVEFNALMQELKASLNSEEMLLNNKEKEDSTMQDNEDMVVHEFEAVEQTEEVVEEVVQDETEVVPAEETLALEVEEVVGELTYISNTTNEVVEEVPAINFELKVAELEKCAEDKDKEIFNLNTIISEMKINFEKLETEIKELRVLKSQVETSKKEEVFKMYSLGLSDDEMKPVKDRMNELSIKDIKIELNEIYTLKNLSELKEKFEIKNDEVIIDIPKKENAKSKYAVD